MPRYPAHGGPCAAVPRDAGAEAQIVETAGYPIVSGGWMTNPTYPTVTIYNHMDVQPAQEPEWKQAPFAFQNENGIYHGRGATDDKGPALRPCSERGMPLSRACRSTFDFFWELEEENGSPHLCGSNEESSGDSSSGFRGRVGHHLVVENKAGHALWPAWFAGRATRLRTGTKDAAFRCDRRRGA